MREVIYAKAEDAKMVVNVVGGSIDLMEFETSDPEDGHEFQAGVTIYDADQARGIIEAIRKVSAKLGWEV
jgi:hypothetical protein